MKKLTLLLLLPALALPAGARGLDAATRKGIDAHAIQFSGRACAGGIEAEPAKDATTQARFKIAVLFLDEMLKEAVAKDRTSKYRSEYNDKDLYRATVFSPKGRVFMMMFFQKGTAYLYKCDLK